MTSVPITSEPQHSTSSTAFQRDQASRKRTLGEDPVPVPSHTAEHVPADYRTINGWGADLDPANRPAVPRELPSNVTTVRGDVKHWQQPHQKIFMSNEMPGLTPVFGETCPPHGVSGALREYAFQFGEATSRHWMTLMLADRVERIEAELWDPKNRPLVLAGGAALVAIGVVLLMRRSR
ncbi:MAG TPA: hypothetical protein VJ853_10950 [Thermoanaerobaculia bacterium]|nr:hypothetical protein [Thermoanaerobaculia bacterium]